MCSIYDVAMTFSAIESIAALLHHDYIWAMGVSSGILIVFIIPLLTHISQRIYFYYFFPTDFLLLLST